MKRILAAFILWALAGSVLPASPITVDFNSLPGPINILGTTTSINGVGFLYDPGGDPGNPPPACTFDEGQGGTQLTSNCVGAQVDTAGVLGTSDGSYVLNFYGQVYALQFGFGLFSFLNPLPGDAEFGLSALIFNGPDLTDVFIISPEGGSMICDESGGCSGIFDYRGQFTQVVLNFSPYSPGDDVSGITYGQTIITMSDMSYDDVPEPGTFLLLAAGLAAVSAAKVAGRRK